jgi:hypothetical protein
MFKGWTTKLSLPAKEEHLSSPPLSYRLPTSLAFYSFRVNWLKSEIGPEVYSADVKKVWSIISIPPKYLDIEQTFLHFTVSRNGHRSHRTSLCYISMHGVKQKHGV